MSVTSLAAGIEVWPPETMVMINQRDAFPLSVLMGTDFSIFLKCLILKLDHTTVSEVDVQAGNNQTFFF